METKEVGVLTSQSEVVVNKKKRERKKKLPLTGNKQRLTGNINVGGIKTIEVNYK